MKTYNIKLSFQNSDQKQFWLNLLSSQRDIVNAISKIKFKKKIINSLKIIHKKCYYKMRKLFPKIPSQIIIKCQQEVIQNYKSIKSNKHKTTSPFIKKKLSLRLDKRMYCNLTKTSIRLQSDKPNKRIQVNFILYPKIIDLLNNYPTCDPLIFSRNGELFLAITFDVPNKPLQNEEVLGIDLGIKRLVVTSDGDMFSSKDYIKYKRTIRYNKRMPQQTNTKSAKRKLKKLRRKEANFSKNYIHNLVNKILETDKGILVLEDLSKIKSKTSKTKEGWKRKKHNNRMGQIPFYMFKQIISYKALHIGKCVETVSPFMTSQNDCRGLENGERKGCRYYAKDGIVLDADWNASINIANKFAKHPITFNCPKDGKLNRQVVFNQPIVVYS